MQRDMTDEELAFDWPRKVASLDDVPEVFRTGYFEADDGEGFVLHPEVAAEVEAGEKRLAELKAQAEADIAEKEAELERLKKATRTTAAGIEIRQALAEHGVKPGLAPAAEAYLQGHLDLQVEEGEDGEVEVSVAGPHGPVSVQHAVGQWLAQEGAAFLEARKPEPGPYAQQMAALKRALH